MKNRKIKNIFWQLPFLIFLGIGTFWILQKGDNYTYYTNEGEIFGTTYHITYAYHKDLKTDILKELDKINKVFSTFIPTSEISLVNQNKVNLVSQDFCKIFNLSEQISQQTNGAFDITVAPLVNAWGFGFDQATTINSKTIDSLKKLTGYQKVKLKGNHIYKEDSRTMLDCSAIAKGYGCDAVSQMFNNLGLINYMIEIGGEIVVKGKNEKQTNWRIGINKPVDDSLGMNTQIMTLLNVTDIALATSGNYRRYYVKGNQKFAHTINPKTGYPVNHSMLSATVLASTCAKADAFATAFMVLGLEKSVEILEQHLELKAYFIYSDNKGKYKTWISPQLKEHIIQ